MSDDSSLPTAQGPWSRELVKEIAMDIGKEVVAHIEMMYPAAISATTEHFQAVGPKYRFQRDNGRD